MKICHKTVYIATHEQDLRAVQTAAVPGFVKVTVYVLGVSVTGFCPDYTLVLIVYTPRCRNKQKRHTLRCKNRICDREPTAQMVINAYIICGPNNMYIYLCI